MLSCELQHLFFLFTGREGEQRPGEEFGSVCCWEVESKTKLIEVWLGSSLVKKQIEGRGASLFYGITTTTSWRTDSGEVWCRRNNNKGQLFNIYISGRALGVSLFLQHRHTLHMHRREKGEILFQWGEQYLTYLDIFLLHTSPLCDNFLTVFTTSAAYYRRLHVNEERSAHRHMQERRENEKRVVLQLERGRCMCHSFFCDATQTTQNTHSLKHTQARGSYPILYAKWHVSPGYTFTGKRPLVSPGTTRDHGGQDGAC